MREKKQLRDLEVEWVSLVDRAATRSPEDPGEPQRYLLTKSEHERKDHNMSTMTPSSSKALDAMALSDAAKTAIEECAEHLTDYSDEPGLSALISKLRAHTDHPEQGAAPAEKLAKALEDLDGAERALVSKSDVKLDLDVRSRLAKSRRALQVEYLHAVGGNAGVWEEARRQAGHDA